MAFFGKLGVEELSTIYHHVCEKS
ncbi:uncharacterized protein G2W53_000751 [Senna tora]|uniref:Uncharacterized protein n=1 Tax=Senna tora TaxID=362788 RepID=A0A834XH55_9FABA|nr:uncharacterized protein G2W53_033804 [Senna tora]KAF7843846.1 uncharacterized protein G2W53_000751 [Senna tora]